MAYTERLCVMVLAPNFPAECGGADDRLFSSAAFARSLEPTGGGFFDPDSTVVINAVVPLRFCRAALTFPFPSNSWAQSRRSDGVGSDR